MVYPRATNPWPRSSKILELIQKAGPFLYTQNYNFIIVLHLTKPACAFSNKKDTRESPFFFCLSATWTNAIILALFEIALWAKWILWRFLWSLNITVQWTNNLGISLSWGSSSTSRAYQICITNVNMKQSTVKLGKTRRTTLVKPLRKALKRY